MQREREQEEQREAQRQREQQERRDAMNRDPGDRLEPPANKTMQSTMRSPPSTVHGERRRERRERLRESRESALDQDGNLRETRAEMRKTRERLRGESRSQRSRRPRSTTSGLRGLSQDPDEATRLLRQSPTPANGSFDPSAIEQQDLAAYEVAVNTAANTAASAWFRSVSPGPSPPSKKGANCSFGIQGIVEQQMQLASEMKKQVEELRRQRDEAREEVLKVREEAINDRAKALDDLQQNLLDQLGGGLADTQLPQQRKQLHVDGLLRNGSDPTLGQRASAPRGAQQPSPFTAPSSALGGQLPSTAGGGYQQVTGLGGYG